LAALVPRSGEIIADGLPTGMLRGTKLISPLLSISFTPMWRLPLNVYEQGNLGI
jgi:hypothetical protein